VNERKKIIIEALYLYPREMESEEIAHIKKSK
jgi:hypothetical protein